MRKRTNGNGLPHEMAVEHANRLNRCRDMTAYRTAIRDLLELQSEVTLTEGEVHGLVAVLADPIAFAMSQRSEEASRYGAECARQSVANALGLGNLEARK